MGLDFLHLPLLLCLCVSSSAAVAPGGDLLEVRSLLQADPTLRCTARFEPGVQYRAVRWYKVLDPPTGEVLSGLLSRNLPDGKVLWYSGVEQEVELQGQTPDILLRNLTCSHAGVYQCHLAAPVGQQNRDGLVRLVITDCPDSVAVKQNTDAILVLIAGAVLMFALVVFCISYFILKNITRDRNKAPKKEIFLNAPLRPLEKQDLRLIYTLGPNPQKLKHLLV